MIKLSKKSTIRCNPQLENQENACDRSSKPLSYFGFDGLTLLKQGHIFDHHANFRHNLGQTRGIKTRKAQSFQGPLGGLKAPPNPQLINSSANADEDVR